MVNTGEEGSVSETIDNFFLKTVEDIETLYQVEKRYFSRDSGGVIYRPDTIPSDRITHLKYRDRVVAGVFDCI